MTDDGWREALARAYEAGALAVHKAWVDTSHLGEGPPRGDPEFSEAANDYARSVAGINPSLTWQPIDDAPKDGTTIFGVDAKMGNRGMVSFNGREWEMVDGLTNMPAGVGFYPTHWHSLLPAPRPATPSKDTTA